MLEVSRLCILRLGIWSSVGEGVAAWLARGRLAVAASAHLDHASRAISCIVEARPHVCLCLRVRGVHTEGVALFDLRVAASVKRLILCFEVPRSRHVLLMLLR